MVNILDYLLINFQVNRTYPSRVIAVGSWVRFCVDSFFSPPFRLGAADLSVSERSERPTSQFGRSDAPTSQKLEGRSALTFQLLKGRSAPTSQKLRGRSALTSQFLKGRSVRPLSFFADHRYLPLTVN